MSEHEEIEAAVKTALKEAAGKDLSATQIELLKKRVLVIRELNQPQ